MTLSELERKLVTSILVDADRLHDAMRNFVAALRCIEEWDDRLPPKIAGEIAGEVEIWLADLQRLRGELAIRSTDAAARVM